MASAQQAVLSTSSGNLQKPANEKQDDSNTSSDNGIDLEGVNEKALVRKLDLRLLPPLTLLYLLSFLDRSNVGNARIEGLVDDLHITGNQYLTGLTLYFIGYVIFEVPCNIILKIWSPRLWFPTLTVAWGVVSTMMGVTQNRTGFFIVRFFLGVAESGLFPGTYLGRGREYVKITTNQY